MVEFDAERIFEAARSDAYLNKGPVLYLDEANQSRTEIQHEGGVADFLHTLPRVLTLSPTAHSSITEPNCRGRHCIVLDRYHI